MFYIFGYSNCYIIIILSFLATLFIPSYIEYNKKQTWFTPIATVLCCIFCFLLFCIFIYSFFYNMYMEKDIIYGFIFGFGHFGINIVIAALSCLPAKIMRDLFYTGECNIFPSSGSFFD